MSKKRDPVAAYLASIGRKGGKVRSEAKAAAVRENGRKGGRPPTKSKAERLVRIRARIDKGQSITPNEAALHYVTLLRSDAKALAWARRRRAGAGDHVFVFWDAVVACIERGVE